MSDGEQTVRRIREQFGEAVVADGSFRDQHWVELRLDRLTEVAQWLRDDPEMDYDFLVDVTAVHWPDDPKPIELIHHLFSYSRNDRLRIKSRASDRQPVPSVSSIWKSAEWNERETYDMFGVTFEGHPDLRRILMPDEYTDFPLRKEFPLYRG